MPNYPLFLGWIYVELFFIITGYFTAKHFYEKPVKENVCENALLYTIKKFKRILFYAVITITAIYIIEFIFAGPTGIRNQMSFLENWLCEVTFIKGGGMREYCLVPAWYISVLFIVFPLFCMTLSNLRINKFFYTYFSWVFPVLYYGRVRISCDRRWPNDMLRALAALYLGVFVFTILKYVESTYKDCQYRGLVTAMEVGSFILPITLCYFNQGNTVLIVFCFLVMTFCVFNGQSYLKIPSNKFTDWLAEI